MDKRSFIVHDHLNKHYTVIHQISTLGILTNQLNILSEDWL